MFAWIHVLIVGLVLSLSPACQPQAQQATLETEDEKVIYAMGHIMAERLAMFALNEEEFAVLIDGLTDAVLGRPSKVEVSEYRVKIQQLQRSRAKQVAEQEKALGEEFLKKEAAMEGATQTDSGLVYRVIEPGTGASPTTDDRIRVHYHGTLRDGTVFDSSVQRGTPFVTKLTTVIPCWTEGMQRMKAGGKSRLVCPAKIAYKDRGAPPHIKPGATIAFDVELIEIMK